MNPTRMIALARPHFLLGGLILYALGAVSAGIDSISAYLIGQLAITASQLTAHFVNEYADADADSHVVNRTWFSGGSGALVDLEVDRRIALRAGLIATAVSLTAAALLATSRPVAAAIAAATLIVSWGYSMPPVRLLDTGWGEAATTVITTVAVPLVGAFAQSRSISAELWWAIAALFPLHMAMIITFEIPDLTTDAAAGKTVLAVRVGSAATRALVLGFFVIGFGVALLSRAMGGPDLRWMLLGLPPAILTTYLIRSRRYELMTGGAVSTLGAAAIGGLIALL